MKNTFALTRIVLAVLIVLCIQGCIKDEVTKTVTYTYFEPVYKTRAEVLSNIKSNPVKAMVLPGKICIKGQYIFVNEVNAGIHVIDNSNPASPVNIAFIDIPGNVDLAIKGNTLYADFYTDLVAIDISNPRNAVVKNTIQEIFPERLYYGYSPDKSMVIVEWIKKTKTVNLGTEPSPVFQEVGVLYNTADAGLNNFKSQSATPLGINGSLSRFALMNNYLYSAGYDSLRITDVSIEDQPTLVNSISVGWGIETIYPFENKLLMGSTSGMFIFGADDPVNPEKLGTFNHVRTCDPVIADNDIAYVTLHSGTTCQGFTNQLDVLNIDDLLNPQLIRSYPLTNPRGLSKDGNLLFICDGADGLKVFDATNPSSVTPITKMEMAEANDVIAYNHVALVMATDGIYQFDYSDSKNIRLLSKLPVQSN